MHGSDSSQIFLEFGMIQCRSPVNFFTPKSILHEILTKYLSPYM